MKKLKALDLFCGAGGAGMGLHRAGFDVIGVDIVHQPRYPFMFLRGDALKTQFGLSKFDLVWANPPCQAHTSMKTMHNALPHKDLIPETRAMLKAAGVPYVIENVVGAPLENPFMLCGTMFGLEVDGAELHRHRIFETNFPVPAMKCMHRDRPVIGVYGGHVRNRRRRPGSKSRGVEDFSIEQAQKAMQIDWMTLTEMCQAIPPAFSAYIAVSAVLSGAVGPTAEALIARSIGEAIHSGDLPIKVTKTGAR